MSEGHTGTKLTSFIRFQPVTTDLESNALTSGPKNQFPNRGCINIYCLGLSAGRVLVTVKSKQGFINGLIYRKSNFSLHLLHHHVFWTNFIITCCGSLFQYMFWYRFFVIYYLSLTTLMTHKNTKIFIQK